MLNVISLGGGVQSSTLALMATMGLLRPMPDAAVYEWLTWLKSMLAFPVYTVRANGSIGLMRHATELRYSRNHKPYAMSAVPAYIKHPTSGKVGVMQRQCTNAYKIQPINRRHRNMLKEHGVIVPSDSSLFHGEPQLTQWLGISSDEVTRMRDNPVPWIHNHYPLVDAGMSRLDCLDWMKRTFATVPPRSACTFCPFHSDREWLDLKINDPKGFAEAVEFERRYQLTYSKIIPGVPFLHGSTMPLTQVEFRSKGSPWENDCTGHCGI